MKTYVFADSPGTDQPHHGDLVNHLAAMLDPFTTRALAPLVDRTTRCLEIGAGAGTIAVWLADRAAHVTATDIAPRHIPAHPRLEVIRHDLTTDPLPRHSYDLIHARLVLAHLPQRRQLVATLADALTPGGALVVDEFDAAWNRCVMDTPDPDAYRLFSAYHHALTATLEAAGADPGWCRAAHQAMRRAGLVDVTAEFWARSWHGGEPGCLLPYAASAQLRDRLVGHGMTPPDIDAFRTLLLDPRLVIYGNLAVSTIGRRAR